ncbi:MAG: hypothetical protein ACNYVW_03550 [Methanosarcinales archaeon]
MERRTLWVILCVSIGLLFLALPVLAAASTTEVHVVKYASDGTTVLNETTVNYTWLEANLQVYGDGTTHYYHQGPTFNDSDPWDPAEYQNVENRDYGAVQGSDVKDICNLVGGMSPGDELKIKASDGFSKRFNYTHVYEPQPRQGPLVLTWKQSEEGYVPDYYEGMRIIFFADNSTNPWGWQVFGNWDMRECFAPKYWHNYSGIWPSSSGLSVQHVSELLIYSTESAPDVFFDNSVTLTEGYFTLAAYNTGIEYSVNNLTPLGALDAAATAGAFGYNVTDKKYLSGGILMLDDIQDYKYNKSGSDKWAWSCSVNDHVLDDWGNPETEGLNIYALQDKDVVYYYYGNVALPDYRSEDAIAAVRITVNTTLSDWDLELVGAVTETVTKAAFGEGVACGHYANWTDPATGEFWEGIPLWCIVGRVDDEIQHDSGAFNDTLAAEGYTLKVIAGDGWSTSLASADIARNDGYIVANALNGSELPLNTSSGKPCWPLHLKGANVTGGQQVGNIAKIELVGLPEPSEGWELKLLGDVGDVITQAEFEEAVACHEVTYTDGDDTWKGIPLWYLCGAVDNLETSSHWTFNDTLAATNYTVKLIAADGYNRTFDSGKIAHDNDYIVANFLNGEPLDYLCPLKLVGSAVSEGNKIGNITKIDLVELITPPPATDSYNLNLSGKITDVLIQAEYEAAADPSCHGVNWTDPDTSDVWVGVPLWFFCGLVDDRIPHGPDGFNDKQAAAGYKIIVKAGDGYAKEFASVDVARNGGYIVADTLNGEPLSQDGSHPPWPLRLVGREVSGGSRVGNIVEIELTEFGGSTGVPSVHIIKYDTDGTTIMNETNVTYQWMEANLQIIGDGTTHYKFEGVDYSGDHWDQNETYTGGFKIDRVVKGTSVTDLCELVGGMGAGTEIELVACDGYETALGYENIYTDELSSEQQERQGEAFLAWWEDDQGYVPDYSNGMRLFFTASDDDHIFGLWDMHECMDNKYWHYYWNEGVQYPSCAGLSAKYVDTIKIYSTHAADWNLTLEGAINDTISKSYFDQALSCTMGGHAAEYTDSKGRAWEGLPLWVLCGWVDDANSHSEGAYNDSLAAAGYNITIFASDGYNVTIDSRDTIRNNNYIVANTLNGTHIPEDDSSWPLKLVGANVSGSLLVKGVAKIKLDLAPVQPPQIFDTGASVQQYPSISGTHNGTISLDYNITVNQLYTYPCTGTGGHTAFARIWNETTGVCAEAHWEGYVDDYHNISFNRTLDLKKGVVYQYTIITGSYPQIIHETSFNTAAGTIRCTEFVDANEKVSYNVIPAITLWQK